MRTWLKLAGLVLVLLFVFAAGSSESAASGCSSSTIEFLTINPNGTVTQGTWLNVHGKGNCGTSKITVNGIDKAEIGNLEITTTIKTEEFPSGNLQICYLLRDDNDGGWQNAARTCQTVTVTGSYSPPTTPAEQVPADVNQYCTEHGYDRGYCTGDAYSCVCERLNARDGIDMYDLCSWQNGGQNPYPGLNSFGSANWTCNRNPAYIASPPVNQPSNPVPQQPNNPEPQQPSQPSNPQPQQPTQPNNPEPQQPNNGNSSNASSSPYSDVQIGDRVVVINSPSSAALLCKRDTGVNNTIKRLTNGAVLFIEAGPVFSRDYYFWEVSGECNGWVADGQPGEPWLEVANLTTSQPNRPNNPATSNTSAACMAPEPVDVGMVAEVTPGDPNTLRSGPGTNYDDVGSIPAGGRFTVVSGPVCAGQYRFWQVNYNGQIAWTADGNNTEYWIQPSSLIAQQGLLDPVELSDELTSSRASAAPSVEVVGPGDDRYEAAWDYLRGETNVSDVVDVLAVLYEINDTSLACFLISADTSGQSVIQAVDYICVGLDLISLNPFAWANVVINADEYIDPWLNQVNSWTWSFPISCLYADVMNYAAPQCR